MILFVDDNNGFLFLKRIIIILKKIVFKSTITLFVELRVPIRLLFSKIKGITINLLINSGIYEPQHIEITSFWEQSSIQSLVIGTSDIVVKRSYITKLREFDE